MFRHFAIRLMAVAALAVVATPVLAAKRGGSTGSSSSITIASADGAAARTQSTTPTLGDTLRFATTVEPLAGWEYPMVAVSCYQDVNGDGWVDTNLLGPDIVFSWLDSPGATFTLGGYVSIWTLRGGGDAVCRADLDAYGWKGGKQSVRVLASTGDWYAVG